MCSSNDCMMFCVTTKVAFSFALWGRRAIPSVSIFVVGVATRYTISFPPSAPPPPLLIYSTHTCLLLFELTECYMIRFSLPWNQLIISIIDTQTLNIVNIDSPHLSFLSMGILFIIYPSLPLPLPLCYTNTIAWLIKSKLPTKVP